MSKFLLLLIYVLLVPWISYGASYEDKNGLVVIEAENLSGDFSNWKKETTFTPYTGSSYIRWNGADNFSTPGNGKIYTKIKITKTGTYKILWRNKVGEGTSSTDCNDSWLRIPDANFYAKKGTTIYYPKGTGKTPNPKGASADGWFKVYSSGTIDWTWSTRTSDNEGAEIYVDFDKVGEYTLEISGRSKNHCIDRIVLFHSSVSEATAKDLNQAETKINSGSGSVPSKTIKYIAIQDFPDITSGEADYYKDTKNNALAIDPNKFQDKYARAITKFTGETGTYDITLTTVAEKDGESTYRIYIGTKKVGEYTNKRVDASGDMTTQTYTVKGVYIEKGQDIIVESKAHTNGLIPEGNSTAWARGRWVDITFTLATGSITPPSSDKVKILGELKLWHKITLSLTGPYAAEDDANNPFLNYRLNVTFTNGDQSFTVPGYFAADGDAANTSAIAGDKWFVHFVPNKTGTWTYKISFRQGTNVAVSDDPNAGSPYTPLDGLTGSFVVENTDKTGRDFRAKGMLQYVGKHHLQFAGTKEYFYKVGSDAPENLLSYADFDGNFKNDGHKDNLVKTWDPHVKDWKNGDPTWQNGKGKGLIGALNYLASEGLNAFSYLTLNINGDDQNVFPYTNYNERYRFDVSRLAQWEIVFEHADKLGMFMDIKTQETENEMLLDNGDVGTQRKLYYRELIARFGHHLGLNWNLGEENGALGNVNQNTAQRIAMAQYFYDHDPYHHLIVIHNGKWPDDLLGNKSKLTGFSLQTNKEDFSNVYPYVKEWVTKSANSGKPWVVFCDEPGDATHALRPDNDAGNSHEDGRKNALWGTLMAGGAGTNFYFGYSHDQSDLTCQDFRSRDKFWDYCRYLLEFLEKSKAPFWEMKNREDLVSGTNVWCLAKENSAYIVYLKTGATATLDLSKATGNFIVKWYNPRTGGSLQNGSITTLKGGSKVSIGNPPSETTKDWVAYIVKNSGEPTISILEPSNNQKFNIGDNVVVKTSASDLDGTVIKTELYVDGKLVETQESANVTFTLKNLTLGEHTIKVVATDNSNNKSSASVVISIIDPNSVPQTLQVLEDAYLENGNLFNNQYLKVEPGKRVSYLKFTVGDNIGSIGNATLVLKCEGDAGNGEIKVYSGATNNWSETNLSSANAPNKVNLLDSYNGSFALGNSYKFDVSSYIKAPGTYTLILEMTTGGNDAWFSSKEGSTAPYLEYTKTTSIEEKNSTLEKKVYIYPNPVLTQATINGLEKGNIRSIKVYNVKGEEQKVSFEAKGESTELDFRRLNKGVYIIIVKTTSNKTLKFRVYKSK